MGATHQHGGGRATNTRRLAITLGLAASYMVAEVVGGLLANSLALLADAGHMLSDVAALALALFAARVGRRPPTVRKTYGYRRAEILAALANAATLIAVVVYVFIEALRRVTDPPEVQGGLVLGIALGGLAVNLAGLWILRGGRAESLNVRGAWLHVLTDALGSVGALTAGALIWVFGWNWADPTASVLIGLLVLYSSWALLRDSVAILMEAAPRHVDVDQVRLALLSLPGVEDVHDLHVWSITSGMESVSCHVRVHEEGSSRSVLVEARKVLDQRFGIGHMTLQVEPPAFDPSAGGCDGCDSPETSGMSSY